MLPAYVSVTQRCLSGSSDSINRIFATLIAVLSLPSPDGSAVAEDRPNQLPIARAGGSATDIAPFGAPSYVVIANSLTHHHTPMDPAGRLVP